ncbi:transcriptional regulator [Salinispira pacifica]|uniref:Transcriptional regulator n=1 Tax=Salinispira pacifica TaxID=1307761 RepID=V5WGY1_9SPIO|nr:transcriptional regulator [Salinispira pacifica]AHC15028.1 Transcriptional regulator [Salinispira pacifica]
MSNSFLDISSRENFTKARKKAFFKRVMSLLQPNKYDLLSLEEVRKLLSPSSESYQGLKAVPIDHIVGSEGRYQDFNKEFLPKRDHLRPRWMNIDKLHLQNVNLPPIQLYEVGGVYFVRDGNHRVSVARSQGIEMIDAEIVSLDSMIEITPEMGKQELREAVIEFEKKSFQEKTGFPGIVPDYDLDFTATGRFNEVLFHILEHKYYINQEFEEELPLSSAVFSWFENVYTPILQVIREYGLLSSFPDRTEGDLYVWIVKHWHNLKSKYGQHVSILEAAEDVVKTKGMDLGERIRYFFQKIFKGKGLGD